ncbi:TPA: hypothetical protein JG951_003137 [Enterobacter hormaechei subsp. steigerwaltii]|nr:hypothetical protein [Enterobacter hormaechei subsp. steigerwaltii]
MNKMKNKIKCLALPLLFLTSISYVSISVAADKLPATSLAQSEGAFGAHYALFEYSDTDSLIKSVRLLEKFGFNTAVVAETLDLNVYRGSVITFKPSAGGKPLSYEDALAAFQNFMKPRQFSVQDAIVVNNTTLSVNEGGTMMNQFYQVLLDGESTKASQPFQVPKDGLAMTVVKMDDGRLLVITTP